MARNPMPQSLVDETRYGRGRHVSNLMPKHEASDDIRISLVESHAIVRAGLRMLLECEDRIEVVSEASSTSETMSYIALRKPSIVLLDIGIEEERDLSALSTIVDEVAPARVLVLTAVEDASIHLRAMERGASGIVMLKQAPEVLIRAVRAISSGESWIGQAISAAAIAKLSRARALNERTDPEAEKIALLTAREREIVSIVAQGYNGARIAATLGISEATVRHHITSILSKLGLSNKLELAVYAFHNHLGPEAGNS